MVHKLILPLTIGCLTAVATLAAAQPQGGQISVRRAFYGSSEAGLSNRIDVTPQVSRQCDGKAACSFECSAQALKVYNPYPNHPKACTVSFHCGAQALKTIVVSSRTQAALDCSNP